MAEVGKEWERFAASLYDPEQDELDFADPPTVVGTGVPSLDSVLMGGLAPGCHVLMAQPGAGKSALALHVAMCVAAQGGRVLFASTEMTRQQCLARLSSAVAHTTPGIPDFYWSAWEQMGRNAKREMMAFELDAQGRLDYLGNFAAIRALRELRRACPGLAVSDDGRVASVSALRETCEEGRKAGMDLLVVDYLQRLRPPDGCEREDQFRQVTETSRALMDMARELSLPVLVISSMNREAMRSKEASMSGGRGSGDIEFDAVSIWQLMRDGEDEGGCQRVSLHVTKNRRGPTTGERPLHLLFDTRHNAFSEVGE